LVVWPEAPKKAYMRSAVFSIASATLAYFVIVGLRNDHLNWAGIVISLIVLGVSALKYPRRYQRAQSENMFPAVVSLTTLAYFATAGLRNDHLNWAGIAMSLILLGVSAGRIYNSRRVES
jgi:hypothetical protein